jgi:hypothetical protein
MKGIIRMSYREDLEYAYQENSKLKLENDELKKKVDKYEITYWLFRTIQSLKKIKPWATLVFRVNKRMKSALCDSDGWLKPWAFDVLLITGLIVVGTAIAAPIYYFDGKHPTTQECIEYLSEANCETVKARPFGDKCICISDGYLSEVSWSSE